MTGVGDDAAPASPRERRPPLEGLLAISRVLLGLDDVEGAVDAALGIAAQTLSIRTAVLLDASGAQPRIFRWPTTGGDPALLEAAEQNARAAYDSLLGTDAAEHLHLERRVGTTALPPLADSVAPAADDLRVALPLVVGRGAVFGVLLLEVSAPMAKTDLTFADTMTNHLSVALDRLRARERETERRQQAERSEARVRAQLELTRAMAEGIVEGVVAVDLDERVTFFNRAAEVMLLCPQRAALGARVADVVVARRADGGPGEQPHHAVLRTGARVRDEDRLFVRADGTAFAALFSCAPIVQEGRVTGAVLAFADVSRRKRREDEDAFLREAEAVLSAGLETASVLRNLARMCVPRLGDACFVDVLVGHDALQRVAWAHADPGAEATLDVQYASAPPAALVGHAAARAILQRGAVLETDDELAPADAADPERVRRAMSARSSIVAPLLHGDEPLGAITLLRLGRSRRHDDFDLALARDLSRRASFAVDNGRRFEAAQRAVRLRDEMLQIVSHDLRNPLASVLLNLEALQRRARAHADDAALAAAVGRIEGPVRRMQRLVEDLLDYAAIESGRMSLQHERHDVAQVVEEARVAHEDAARAAGLTLVAAADRGVGSIVCDRDRVLQVLGNLLGNAIKITPRGGVVDLRGAVVDDGVVFTVSDTGPGIARADQARIFDRFARGADARYRGSGLGLAISRSIVDAHGGRIWVEGEPGAGARFCFILPASPDAAR